VIEYLKNPPSKSELIQLIADAGLTVREAIRKNVDPYRDLELDLEVWRDEKLLNFMLQYPILINRGAFTKEDGEQVLDANGQRLK